MKWLFILFSLSRCTTTDENIHHGSAPVDPAAYAADNMTFSRPTPKREKTNTGFQFYFRHCQVESKVPPPVGQIWECSEP